MLRKFVLAFTAFSGVALTAGLLLAQASRTAEVQFKAAQQKELVEGNLKGAIKDYEKIASGKDRALGAQALLHMAECYQKLGDADANKVYQRLIRDFADQADAVSVARARLSGAPGSSDRLASRLVCECGDYETSMSADGRWIAYTDYSNGDIMLRDLSTGQEKRLMAKTEAYKDSVAYAEEPVFSPDLRQVVYNWQTGSGGARRPTQLRITANEPGGKSHSLLDSNADNVFYEPLSWSPDEKSILLLIGKADRTAGLAWVSTADNALKMVKSLQWRLVQKGGIDPKLSPDGRYIAYHARAVNPIKLPPDPKDSVDRHIYVLAADGSSESEVVKTAGGNSSPVWTPDGKHLLFLSSRSGDAGLWSVAIENGKAAGSPVLLKSGFSGTYYGAGWVYPVGVTRSGSYYYMLDRGGLEEISIAGLRLGASRTSEKIVGIRPVWSPDGKSLAFKRHQYGNPEAYDLVVHSLETGDEKTFPSSLGENTFAAPVWSHDGKSLLVGLVRNRAFIGGYRMDLASGEYKQLLDASHRIGESALSPDEKTLYTLRSAGAFALDLATGNERMLYPFSGDLRASFALSPDGRTIALWYSDIQDRKTFVAAVNVDNGNVRRVVDLDFFAYGEGAVPAWTKDSRTILFVRRQQGKYQVMRIPAQGGAAEFTGIESAEEIESLDISPDDSRIAFSTATKGTTELRAIDNVLSALK